MSIWELRAVFVILTNCNMHVLETTVTKICARPHASILERAGRLALLQFFAKLKFQSKLIYSIVVKQNMIQRSCGINCLD